MAVSIGKDGTLLVDDDFAALAARGQTAISAVGGSQPKIVLNTHFHADHTGSNASFGGSAVIIANEQVRYRLLNDPALPRSALPVVTYADRLHVQFNDDDLFLNSSFPFIDVENGGNVDGYITNAAKIMEMIPADTRIIPGHGRWQAWSSWGSFTTC